MFCNLYREDRGGHAPGGGGGGGGGTPIYGLYTCYIGMCRGIGYVF